mmetsp:Transcript_93800/g.264957  ORF Transcript_93800/g.264957 Transcript_93800/m.264957 type:complete len:363 (-) Transcript_93800:29-1117(-)
MALLDSGHGGYRPVGEGTSVDNVHGKASVGELRTELAQLDSELGEATMSLQRQRGLFAERVAEHDAARVERAAEVQQAWNEFEAEREHMEMLHRELADERYALEGLEVDCRDLGGCLRARGEAAILPAENSRNARQSRKVEASTEDDAPLLRKSREQLEAAISRRETLREEMRDGEAFAALGGAVAGAAFQSTGPPASRAHLCSALQSIFEEAVGAAETAAMRVQGSLVRAECQAASAQAATTLALRRRRARGRWSDYADVKAYDEWAAEADGLLCSLEEAKFVATQCVQLAARRSKRRCGDDSSMSLAAAIAHLRRDIVMDLHTGLEAALAEYPPVQSRGGALAPQVEQPVRVHGHMAPSR